MIDDSKKDSKLACQTLFKALDILDAVALHNITSLPDITSATGMAQSTAYRLASALVQREYLLFEPRVGYRLGPKLMQLGFLTYSRVDKLDVLKPVLARLAEDSMDTVHLGTLHRHRVFYIEKMVGARAVQISSMVGGFKPACSTGIGKALLLDASDAQLVEIYDACKTELGASLNYSKEDWLAKMHGYRELGYAFDLGEDSPEVYCVAAPIYDMTGKIMAALSISSAVHYMDEKRLNELGKQLLSATREASHMLGA